VFNLNKLIVLRTEKTAFKKFGAKKLAGTFFYDLTKLPPAPGNAFPSAVVLPAPRNRYF
jgi:hypothetical protein